MFGPDTINHYSSSKRILRGSNSFGQFHSTAALAEGLRLAFAEHGKEMARNFFAWIRDVAADCNLNVVRFISIRHYMPERIRWRNRTLECFGVSAKSIQVSLPSLRQ